MKKRKIVFAGIAVQSLMPILAVAQIQNPSPWNNLPDFFVALLNAIVTISVPIVVLMVIYAGFLFVTANGKPEEINKAKRTLLWTLLGALIILGADILANAIQSTIADIRP